MVARARGRVNQASALTGPTPFADAALDLYDRGLVVVPLGGPKGQTPLTKWRKFGRDTVKRFTDPDRFGPANVGVLTGPSGVTMVDIDDPDLVDAMVARFGGTPLKMTTPRGGFHLWFKTSGERCQLALDGLAVDIKGIGGMVVVPPSVRPSGPHAGKVYAFLDGSSWDALNQLPTMAKSAMTATPKSTTATPKSTTATPKSTTATPKSTTVTSKSTTVTSLRPVRKGVRNKTLFKAGMVEAPQCGNPDQLLGKIQTINASFDDPLSIAEVAGIAKSVWGYQSDGLNRCGQPAHIPIAVDLVDRLLASDPKHGPDALALYVKLRAAHTVRDQRGDPFAIAGKAMAHNVLPWSSKRIYAAAEILVDCGLVDPVLKGGRGPGSASQ